MGKFLSVSCAGGEGGQKKVGKHVVSVKESDGDEEQMGKKRNMKDET